MSISLTPEEKEILRKVYKEQNLRRKEKKLGYREKTVVCAICGHSFKTIDFRRKYCSDKCALEGFRRTSNAWNRAQATKKSSPANQ